jgi:hypothetical protein
LLREDRALKLAERQVDELLSERRRDDPPIGRVGTGRGRLSAHLELMAALRAPNRGAAPAYERVVELVFGFAPLALDVHDPS